MGRDASDEKRLSLADLVIASVSSAAAAVIVHALWKPGTVIAAARTPILMSLFAEALRRPAELAQGAPWRRRSRPPRRATILRAARDHGQVPERSSSVARSATSSSTMTS